MVALDRVQASNALIPTSLSANLVAVFVGATSGIGEATLKAFAATAVSPRVYFVGRSKTSGDRVAAECKAINPGGSYMFIQADTELMRNVDVVASIIKEKESIVNILFLSQGDPQFDRTLTSEGLNIFLSSLYYARTLLTYHLLPLLRRAAAARATAAPANLARVVTVGSACSEGPLAESDLRAFRIPLLKLKPHCSTLLTLTLEALAAGAPDVVFIHDFPGFVRTPYQDRMGGAFGVAARAVHAVAGRWISTSLEESGARHLFECTSAVYGGAGVPLVPGLALAKGVDGEVGGMKVYSVGAKSDVADEKVVEVLKGYRETGWVKKIDRLWKDDVGNARGQKLE